MLRRAGSQYVGRFEFSVGQTWTVATLSRFRVLHVLPQPTSSTDKRSVTSFPSSNGTLPSAAPSIVWSSGAGSAGLRLEVYSQKVHIIRVSIATLPLDGRGLELAGDLQARETSRPFPVMA